MKNVRSAIAGITVAAVAAIAMSHFALQARADQMAAAAPAPTATPVLVTIKDFAYSPNVVSIPVGGAVTFKNLDSASHTATDSKGAFDSGNLDTGKSFTYKFAKAGTYSIGCSYHPSMHATIVVGSTATPPLPTPESGY